MQETSSNYTPDSLPQSVLITGAGRRIGRAIALDFGKRGWAVAVHYNHSAIAATEVVSEIRAFGGKACAVSGDLSREEYTITIIPKVVETFGPLGCLVNNASLFLEDTIFNMTRESWDAHIEVNLRAPLVLTQGFAHQLPDNSLGVVINIIDQRVWRLTPNFTSYTVSKAALWALTQTLALALAPRIRVDAIGPGPTLPSVRQTVEQFREQCQNMPLRRGTTPEEIAEAVQFIIRSPAMTGQMIALDGGQHLGWMQPNSGRSKFSCQE